METSKHGRSSWQSHASLVPSPTHVTKHGQTYGLLAAVVGSNTLFLHFSYPIKAEADIFCDWSSFLGGYQNIGTEFVQTVQTGSPLPCRVRSQHVTDFLETLVTPYAPGSDQNKAPPIRQMYSVPPPTRVQQLAQTGTPEVMWGSIRLYVDEVLFHFMNQVSSMSSIACLEMSANTE